VAGMLLAFFCLDAGYWILVAGIWLLDSGCWMGLKMPPERHRGRN